MNETDKTKFLIWHKDQDNKIFNFKEQINIYCMNDCLVLMNSFMKFRKDWIDIYDIDFSTRCISLPQAVMEIYKSYYLPKKSIAIVPFSGYENKRNSSYMGNIFLSYIEKTRSIKIIREFKFNKYYADGYCIETKEFFEFFGCKIHGCKRCYNSSTRYLLKCPFTNKSMDELYDDVINKLNFYQSQKFKVCKIWECEFKELINEDEFLKLFVKNQYRNLHNSKYVPNIDPRDAFFGGRCSPAKLYHKVEFDEKILYLDFCSLYPYCCKRFPYPKGHPKIMKIFDNLDITKIKGLIFCTILPPTNLRFPVLPMRMNDKLFFHVML